MAAAFDDSSSGKYLDVNWRSAKRRVESISRSLLSSYTAERISRGIFRASLTGSRRCKYEFFIKPGLCVGCTSGKKLGSWL